MARLSQLFAPKEREFFDLFEEAGANLVKASSLLEEMLETWPEKPEIGKELLACEHEGDRITHDIIQKLNQTFVTPIDREDIYALASALDDVVDFIEEAGDFLNVYQVETSMVHAQKLATLLAHACVALSQAIPRLRSLGDIRHFTVEVNRLENEGDRVLREGLAALFRDQQDPMFVIRWKDILERIESGLDATEKAANILEGTVIKNT